MTPTISQLGTSLNFHIVLRLPVFAGSHSINARPESSTVSQVSSHQIELDRRGFMQDVVDGFDDFPKHLPCKYFYDAQGSQLFDQICDLDEYYLTRTEQWIMDHSAEEIGRTIGRDAAVIELGSGSSTKTRVLLDHLIEPNAYVPVDISGTHLRETARRLQRDYPHLRILPVAADFTSEMRLPVECASALRRVVYFPGSTIGNFTPDRALDLLRRIADVCGDDGGMLIGVDLVKSVETLTNAYDDESGVTAAFNLNLLRRIRDELDCDVELADFEHVVFYNEEQSRIEIYLRSLVEQTVQVGDRRFSLAKDELIHTEYSHKYTVNRFAKLAAPAGFRLRTVWTDPDEYFAVMYLESGGC